LFVELEEKYSGGDGVGQAILPAAAFQAASVRDKDNRVGQGNLACGCLSGGLRSSG